jgi:hypothetical protein
LLGQIILLNEAIVASIEAVVGVAKVNLVMNSNPAMVEIGRDTETGIVKRHRRRGAVSLGG